MTEMGAESRPEATESPSDAAAATTPEAGEGGPAMPSDNQMQSDVGSRTGDVLSASSPPEAGEGLPAGTEQTDRIGDQRFAEAAEVLRSNVTKVETVSPADQTTPLPAGKPDSANQHSIDGQDLPSR